MKNEAANTDGLLIHPAVHLDPEGSVYFPGICNRPPINRITACFRIFQNRMNRFHQPVSAQPFGPQAFPVRVPMIQNNVRIQIIIRGGFRKNISLVSGIEAAAAVQQVLL